MKGLRHKYHGDPWLRMIFCMNIIFEIFLGGIWYIERISCSGYFCAISLLKFKVLLVLILISKNERYSLVMYDVWYFVCIIFERFHGGVRWFYIWILYLRYSLVKYDNLCAYHIRGTWSMMMFRMNGGAPLCSQSERHSRRPTDEWLGLEYN